MATHSNPGAGRPAEGRNGLPAAVVEDLLASPERRRLLGYLHEQGRPVPVDDLAPVVATGEVTGDPTAAARRRARTAIYQEHLPKLTATGTVAFDSLLGTVEFTGCPALVARLEHWGGSVAETEDK